MKLFGGAQYEPLYATISEWEEATGATVEILSRKNHFELDREIKQDIAAGTHFFFFFLTWWWGRTTPASRRKYGNIYADLERPDRPRECWRSSCRTCLDHSTVDGPSGAA